MCVFAVLWNSSLGLKAVFVCNERFVAVMQQLAYVLLSNRCRKWVAKLRFVENKAYYCFIWRQARREYIKVGFFDPL